MSFDAALALLLAGMALGASLAISLQRREARKANPYTWVCLHLGCYFRARASDQTILHLIADEHMRRHREEFLR